jgi:hypothetical protein
MNHIVATVIALALCTPVAAHAELTKAEVNSLPCAKKPTHSEVDGVRIALISLGISIEKDALGQSKNPHAEAAEAAAINDVSDQMSAAWTAGDKDGVNAAMCKITNVQETELTRQLTGETPDEQASIARFALQMKAASKDLNLSAGSNATAADTAVPASGKDADQDAKEARAAAEKAAQAEAEDDRSRIEAEAKAKIEAERAQIEAEAKAAVRAKIEADLRAKAVAEATAKAEAEAKADIEAAEKAKDKAAADAKAAAEARIEAEAVVRNDDQVRKDKEAAETKAREDARIEAEAAARNADNVRAANAAREASIRADKEAAEVKASEEA